MLTIGSLFSGIGGLELGLERAGLGPVKWQVEIDPFCREILAKHWPNVERFEDVRTATPSRVDLVCGGPPCQDLSDAARGRNAGLDGPRSRLILNMVDFVASARPRWVVMENVDGAAWKRWVPVVRRKLWELRYPSVPIRVRAKDVGAPFKGSRVFIVASAHGEVEPTRALDAEVAELSPPSGLGGHWREPAPWHLGVDDGVPSGVQRRRAVANAVVPAQAETVGRYIVRCLTAPDADAPLDSEQPAL